MNPLKSFLNGRKVKASIADDIANNSLFGWHPTGGVDVLSHYHNNQYENGYGSITKIVNTFMDIKPYTVDEKGNKVESNLMNRLYHPNQDMSSSDFREALAVMSLIHDRVFVLVWRLEGGVARPGGDITPENLAGFTFLQNPVVTISDNKKFYTYNGAVYSESEVIELKDINPYNLTKGFSPARAAEKWATIDDYIAAYQTGFFKNGAVPAGQFIITASTIQDFNDEVDKLEAKHRGAGKNNNIVYVHRPTDREGKPSNAKIEWVPFNVQNKDLSLNDIFEQANKKIDSAYGVPAEIRGILSNSNYASVNVAEKIFIKYVMKPFTQKLWTRFTHQLNRITGGLGVAISFELEVPGLVDEEKIEEETAKIRDERVQLYLERGYTIASIKSYLDTGDLTQLETNTPAEQENNDDVDEGDEVEDSPDVPDGQGDGRMYNRGKATVLNQVSSRDYPDLYEGTGIDPNDLGCIMLDIESLSVLEYVESGEDDLINETTRHDHAMGAVAEYEPHVTLLYGLLENGNIWKDKVDSLLEGWSLDNVKVSDVSYFDLPESYAIIAHIETTTDLQDGHDRLTLLPHINTFSEYKPHLTLAYISKEADLGKWLTSLNAVYAGKELSVTGINYGDEPEESSVSNLAVYNMHCKDCDRFVGTTTNSAYSDQIKCANSKCKALEVPVLKEAVATS